MFTIWSAKDLISPVVTLKDEIFRFTNHLSGNKIRDVHKLKLISADPSNQTIKLMIENAEIEFDISDLDSVISSFVSNKLLDDNSVAVSLPGYHCIFSAAATVNCLEQLLDMNQEHVDQNLKLANWKGSRAQA